MQDKFSIKAQIEVTTNKPPIMGMQVQNLDELTTSASKLSYLHKVVWVISERGYYYLSTGNGTNLNQWLPVDIGAILQYQNKPYPIGSAVILNGKVFIALVPINLGEDPINSPDKWLNLSDVKFTQQGFVNVTELTVTTPYTNPNVIVYDTDGNEISAFIVVSGGVVKLDMYPAASGYVVVKE